MQKLRSADTFRRLRDTINRSKPVVIQTHDFPDLDAIAVAFGLQQLLAKFSYDSTICYGGEMRSPSLLRTINHLHIEMRSVYNKTFTADTQIIVVDGCFENKNITKVTGKIVGMIDHHEHSFEFADNYQFVDVKLYGACSTIITEYYFGMDIPPSPRVATALLIGIMMDTSYLTRNSQENDIAAVQKLFSIADWYEGARLLRNSLSMADLALFHDALENHTISDYYCNIVVNNPIKPDSAALLADFFLSVGTIHFVVVIINHEHEYRLSVRSEDKQIPAHKVLQQALGELGSGGGHAVMAGGVVPKQSITVEDIHSRFLATLNIEIEENTIQPSLDRYFAFAE